METLVAAFVLGLLTALAVGLLAPVFQKTVWNDSQHDRRQGLVVAREHLGRMLEGARLLEPVGPDRVRFILPRTVSSSWGLLGVIDDTETLEWNESDVREIAVENGVLFERLEGETNRRPIWFMGEGGWMEVSFDGTPLVGFRFGLPAGEDSPAWEGGFSLYLRGLP